MADISPPIGLYQSTSLAQQVAAGQQEAQRRRRGLARINKQLPASGSWNVDANGNIGAGYGGALDNE